MGLFDYFRELAVEPLARVSSYVLTAAKGELGEIWAEIQRRKEEEALRKARERAARIIEREEENVNVRHKSRFCRVSAGRDEILSTLSGAETFGHRIQRLVAERCEGNPAVCYKRAGISRQVYSRIVCKSPGRVSKETALRITLALRLSYEEALDLLASAGFALSDSEKLDVVFSYCLKHGIYSLFDVNELLVAIGDPPLKID